LTLAEAESDLSSWSSLPIGKFVKVDAHEDPTDVARSILRLAADGK
jgi:hypothetical protein